MRDLLIAVHALAGVLAFVAGTELVRDVRAGRPPPEAFGRYEIALAVVVAALVPAVLLDWPDLEAGTRAAFAALVALALVLVARAELARRLRDDRSVAARRRVVEHVGFTLVALVVGFVVVAAINLGIPPWGSGAIGATTVLIGHRRVAAARRAVGPVDGTGSPRSAGQGGAGVS